MGKLTKPARVGATVFAAGVDEQLVIERAQREYVYRETEKQFPADWRQRLMQDPRYG